jgi:hypothetical protein
MATAREWIMLPFAIAGVGFLVFLAMCHAGSYNPKKKTQIDISDTSKVFSDSPDPDPA